MILQSAEATFAAHLRVAIGECGEYDVIDFLHQSVAPGDDFHRVPFMVLEVALDLFGVLDLRHGFFAIGLKRDSLTCGGHQMTGLVFRVVGIKQGVVPKAHLRLSCDFDLVSMDLPVTQIIAADLNA